LFLWGMSWSRRRRRSWDDWERREGRERSVEEKA